MRKLVASLAKKKGDRSHVEVNTIITEMMEKVDDDFTRFDSETLNFMRCKLPANIRGFIPDGPD